MGGFFSISSDSDSKNKIILYRVDHDLLLSSKEEEQTTFFTNFNGLLCYLNNSKHKIDNNIHLFKYECDLNIFEIAAIQEYMRMSIIQPIDNKYKDDSIFCKDIKDVILGQLKRVTRENIDKMRELSNKYGGVFTINSSKLGFIDHIDFKLYSLNVNNTINEIKKLDNYDNLFNKMIDKGHIKQIEDENIINIISNDIKKTKDKRNNELSENKDGRKHRKKRKSRSKSKKRKSR